MIKLLRRRNFALLWWGSLISDTGDWFLAIGLPIAVYLLTGSALITSTVFIAELVPALLLGSIAGVFADRWDRRRLMVIVSLLQAVGLLPLLLVHSAQQIWIVYAVSIGEAILAQFFLPAANALLPRLVDEQDLVPANSLNSISQALARLIGSPLGGLVVGLLGLRGSVLLDACSFLIAGLLIAAMRVAPQARQAEPARASASWGVFWGEWIDGLRLVWRSPRLAVLLLVAGLQGFAQGIFQVLYIVFVLEILHGGDAGVGLLRGVQAIGSLLGGLVIGLLGARLSAARLVGAGAMAFGVIDLAIWNAPRFFPSLVLAAALFILAGIPGVGMATGANTLLQTEAADQFRGRVFGAFNTTTSLLLMIGLLVAGALGDRLGVLPVLNLQGSMYVLSGVIALIWLGTTKASAALKEHGATKQDEAAEPALMDIDAGRGAGG
jgi:MFS family permease